MREAEWLHVMLLSGAGCSWPEHVQDESPVEPPHCLSPSKLLFGLPLEEYDIEQINEFKKTLSNQLADLLAEYHSFHRDEKSMYQELELYPSDESFFSSYCKFVKNLLPDSEILYLKTIDLVFSRVGFELSFLPHKDFNSTTLEWLGPETLSQIRYLRFLLNDDGDGKQFEAWKQVMERSRDVLPYHKVHLVMEFTFWDQTRFDAVLDVLKSMPRMWHCSLQLSPGFSPVWNQKIKEVVRSITTGRKELSEARAQKFHMYSSLPRELRLLVLSFAGLAPEIYMDPNGPQDNLESERVRPPWMIYDHYWYDGKNCCHRCASIWMMCCCNFRNCCASTSCACSDDFRSLLQVSRQFRAESLEILFSNDFTLSYQQTRFSLLDNLQNFLNWSPTLQNLHFARKIVLVLSGQEFDEWRRDVAASYKPRLDKYLNALVGHSGPLTGVFLVLSDVGIPDESRERQYFESLQKLESEISQVIEKIRLTSPNGSKIRVDWGSQSRSRGLREDAGAPRA